MGLFPAREPGTRLAPHAWLFLILALAGAALDLLSKHLAFEHIKYSHDEVTVIDGLFSFGRTLNPGVIFGMGHGAQTLWLVVSIVAVPAILAIFFSIRKPRWILSISLGFILAGTIGNMYDRVMPPFHAVRDFIKFYTVKADGTQAVWPLFNLADSFICVGVFLLTVEMLFFDEPRKRKNEPPKVESAPPVAPLSETR
jgi:signal peptidase II